MKPMQCQRSPRAARRGVVLVLFALLAVGFLAIAGIAIDLGLARMNQRQMQGAADSVALETLRERDWARIEQAETDPYLRDVMRRVLSSRLAAWRYTEGLPLTLDDGSIEFGGGGGYIELSQGQGNLNWGRHVQSIGWGVPRLASNYELDNSGPDPTATPFNERHGDIVSGSFSPALFGPGGNPFRMESADYQRADFEAADPSVAPYADSILVRMRRTGGGGLDEVVNVSTTGRTMPMLFSAGTAIQGGDPSDGPNVRHTGFSMRATSIATARRAVRAGVRVPEPVLQDMLDLGQIDEREASLLRIGVAGLALNQVLWNYTGTELWEPSDDGEAEIYLEIRAEGNPAANVLSKYDPDLTNPWGEFPVGCLQWIQPRNVGDHLPFWPPSDEALRDPEHWRTDEGLVPIYTGVGAAGMRVVGFGRIRTEIATDPATGLDQYNGEGYPVIRLIRLSNTSGESPSDLWIAPRNASALFDGTQADDLSQSDWDTGIIPRWKALRHAVHAPALAR